MAVVIDLIRKKSEHHVFNYAIVKALDSLFKNNRYYLDVSSSSIESITNSNQVSLVDVKATKSYLWLTSTLKLIKILLKHKNEEIFLLSATPLQYFVCSLLSKLYGVNVALFMHGELGYLSKAMGLGEKLGRKFIRLSFSIRSRVKFVAIDEYVKDKVSDMFSDLNVYLVRLPIQVFENKNKVEKTHLNIGAFGVQSSKKNSSSIYELAKKLSSMESEIVKLLTVGVSDGSFEYGQSQSVEHLCQGLLNKALVPKDVFLNNVSTLDFALFFNGYDTLYDLIPSGVVSDCIALEIPIISLSNHKLEFMFEQYGVIGYLCESIDEMAKIISSLNKNEKDICMFKDNLRRLKAGYSDEKLQQSLQELLDEKY